MQENRQPFFSVIIPVYNVENYLSKCLDSLLCQSFDDFEMLLIDDGSTDQSGTLCDTYSLKSQNIRVFHKVNGGLSDARNFGIKHACGQYLIFVDSDDWIDKRSLSIFYDNLKANPEVLITRIVEAYEDHCVYHDEKMKDFFEMAVNREKAIRWIFSKSQDAWPSVKYVVSRKFIVEHDYWFSVGKLHEDVEWCCNVIAEANSFGVCDYPWYFYRKLRTGSISNTISEKNIIDVILTVANYIDNHDVTTNDEIKMIATKLNRGALFRLTQIRKCTEDGKEKVIQSLIENQQVLNLQLTNKLSHKLIVIMCKILGIRNALNILSLFP